MEDWKGAIAGTALSNCFVKTPCQIKLQFTGIPEGSSDRGYGNLHRASSKKATWCLWPYGDEHRATRRPADTARYKLNHKIISK